MKLRRSVSEETEVRYRIASLLLLTAAVLLLIGSIGSAVQVRDLARRGETTHARVTEGPQPKNPSLEITYRTRSGETVTARTSRYLSDLDSGDELTVEYDPVHPDRVQEAGWGVDYSTPVACAVGAVVALLLGLGCVLRRWPRRLERHRLP